MPEIVLPQIRYTSVGVVSACAQKSRKCPTLEARCCSDRAESAKTVRWVSLFDGADGRREVAVLPLPPHFEIKFKFWAHFGRWAQNVPKSQMCPKAKCAQKRNLTSGIPASTIDPVRYIVVSAACQQAWIFLKFRDLHFSKRFWSPKTRKVN